MTTSPAIAIWQDSAARDVYVCRRHDNRSAAEEAFAHLHPADGPFGTPRCTADLVGGSFGSACQHPEHRS